MFKDIENCTVYTVDKVYANKTVGFWQFVSFLDLIRAFDSIPSAIKYLKKRLNSHFSRSFIT